MIGGYQATPPSHKQQKAMMTTCRWGHPWAFAWSPLFYITTSACLSSCSLFAASKLAAATTDFGEKRREQSQQARTALLSQKLCRSQGASRRQQAESIGDSSELFAVCSDLFPHTNVTNVRISAVRISPRHTQQATHNRPLTRTSPTQDSMEPPEIQCIAWTPPGYRSAAAAAVASVRR